MTAVHPPTTEHVYAQWQERKESRPPLGLLQDDNGQQSLDIKEEEAATPMSGDSASQNHFKNSRAAKFKGKSVILRSWWRFCECLGLKVVMFVVFIGKRGRLSKADLDTGWSKDDERQCSLCQKYGDLKPNVRNAVLCIIVFL